MMSASHLPAKIELWAQGWGTGLNRSLARLAGLRDFRLRLATAHHRASLEAACVALAALPAEIESRFLACGSALHEQVKLTSQLLAQATQLREHGGHGEGAVTRSTSAIAANLDLSASLADKVRELAAHLEHHAEDLHRLLGDQQTIERSFAPMQVLHALLRIESALLPAEVRSQFHTVTAEMQRLHADVSQSFAVHHERLSRTRHDALVATQRLRAQAAEHHELIARKRTDAQQSLSHLQTELARIRDRNQRLHTAIADLDRETDAITVSLQYQDITRQKIEHIATAARDVLAGFIHPDDTPFPRRVRLLQALCQVQSVQLAAVHAELQRAATTISSGLHTMLDRLQRIERECLSLDELHQVAAQMDAVTAKSVESHQLGVKLVHNSLDSLTQSIASAEIFAAATTGATDTMRRIAMDIHFMGLNAQVQAVQANNGSLEVLASAAAGISSEAGGLTLRFEEKLVSATAALARFIDASRAFHDARQTEQGVQRAEHEALVHELAERNETGKALIAKVGALLQQLRDQAKTLLQSIDLAEFSREAIEQARTSFDALAALCGAACVNDAVADEAILAEVSSRYTMSSERAAHAAALGVAAAEPAPVAGSTGVELFDQPADAPGAQAGPAPIAVAVEPAAVAVSTPAPTPSGESLGDNVELF